MAKSKILKQLARGEIEIETVLKELRVLLMDFDKPELLEWVDCELKGYPHSENETMGRYNVPVYRIAPGVLKGTYTYGNKVVKNIALPLMPNAPEELLRFVTEVPFYESISSLRMMLNREEGNVSPIAMRLSGQHNLLIQANSAIHMSGLLEAYVEVSQLSVQKVMDSVTVCVMDILKILEREFGCLDELDIEVESKTEDEKKKIVNNIFIVINDNRKSVGIGDNNKIQNVKIDQ